MVTAAKTERIPNARRTPMSLRALPKYMTGPFHRHLIRRTVLIYCIAAVI